MTVTELELKGLKLIALTIHRDARGFFTERFQMERFWEQGLPNDFLQDNHSRSLPGVLRGLHYQRSPAQGKLVGVIRGGIWDVAVDLRSESSTYGKWFGTELSDTNGRLLWIPPGFAHGFCVLGDEPADVYYKVDAAYNATGEGGILWNDPELAIPWPVPNPVVSPRDQQLESFAAYNTRPIRWEEELPAGRVPPITETGMGQEAIAGPHSQSDKVLSRLLQRIGVVP